MKAKEKKTKTKHARCRENKDSQNRLPLWKGLLSLPSPSSALYHTPLMPISPPLCSMRNMDGPKRRSRPLSFHIWNWSEGLLEVEASGPINNHAAELRVRQQSADEPVSTKHKSPNLPPPLPPSSREQLSLLKNELARDTAQTEKWYTRSTTFPSLLLYSQKNYNCIIYACKDNK